MSLTEQLKNSKKAAKSKSSKIKATRVLTLGFLVVIAIGTLLLMMPFSVQDGNKASFIDALFTSVSATCVTGLSTVNTAAFWSTAGQIIILVMIQVGGLGFMTLAVLISKIAKKMLTPKDKMLVAMSYNLNTYGGVSELIKSIAIGTAVFEGIGAVILFTRFVKDYTVGQAIFRSIFTSVSSFCNAGFDLVGDKYISAAEGSIPYMSSMGYYATDATVCLTLTALTLIGGIGFIVWFDLKEKVTKRRHLSPYTKFVLIITLILLSAGTLIFSIFEWNNNSTIGYMTNTQKIIASVFHSMSLRTSGFAIFDNGSLTSGSIIISLILMFIGGASGSTAGGVKMVTFGVLIYTVWCNVTGKQEAVIFKRKISSQSFVRAATVIFVQLFLILTASSAIIAMSKEISGIGIIYEAVSAVSTVGLSFGITSSLGIVPKVILIFLMYFGRVGILSVAYSLTVNQNSYSASITYPDSNFLIG